jgi:hypothetical protein
VQQVHRSLHSEWVGQYQKGRAQSRQQITHGRRAVDPSFKCSRKVSEKRRPSASPIHDLEYKSGEPSLFETSKMYGLERRITHHIIEQVRPVSSKPMRYAIGPFRLLVKINSRRLAILLKIALVRIGTYGGNPDSLRYQTFGDTASNDGSGRKTVRQKKNDMLIFRRAGDAVRSIVQI